MGNFFMDNPPPMSDQMNPDGSGGLAGGGFSMPVAPMSYGPYGNDFTPRNAQGNPNVAVRQAPPAPAAPVASQGAQGDYQSEFMQAAQELGISPQQFRGNPEVMDRVTQYLNQKYPGQNWTNGGARAGDWISVNGQGEDVLPSGDRNWQWLSDPANSTAGSGGDSGYGGYNFASNGLTPTQQIEQTPGYQFSVGQAMDAIQHSAAARGTLLSGGLMKNLGSYIANSVAGPAYQSQIQNLYNVAGLGQNAAAMTGNAGSQYAGRASDLLTGIGNANAAGQIGAANAWNTGLGGVANAVNTGIAAQVAKNKQPQPPMTYSGSTA